MKVKEFKVLKERALTTGDVKAVELQELTVKQMTTLEDLLFDIANPTTNHDQLIEVLMNLKKDAKKDSKEDTKKNITTEEAEQQILSILEAGADKTEDSKKEAKKDAKEALKAVANEKQDDKKKGAPTRSKKDDSKKQDDKKKNKRAPQGNDSKKGKAPAIDIKKLKAGMKLRLLETEHTEEEILLIKLVGKETIDADLINNERVGYKIFVEELEAGAIEIDYKATIENGIHYPAMTVLHKLELIK